MGSSNFENTTTGKTATEAYNSLVERARIEHGHNSYNGTIATTSGFVTITPKPGEDPNTCMERILAGDLEGVHKWGLEGVHKWGHAGCIDLGPVKTKGERKFVFFGWAAE